MPPLNCERLARLERWRAPDEKQHFFDRIFGAYQRGGNLWPLREGPRSVFARLFLFLPFLSFPSKTVAWLAQWLMSISYDAYRIDVTRSFMDAPALRTRQVTEASWRSPFERWCRDPCYYGDPCYHGGIASVLGIQLNWEYYKTYCFPILAYGEGWDLPLSRVVSGLPSVSKAYKSPRLEFLVSLPLAQPHPNHAIS